MPEHRIGQRTKLPRWRVLLWGGAALLLLAPAAAMRLTSEMNWGPGDFAIFGAMLLAVCVALELNARFARRPRHRVLIALVVIGVFLLIWAQLAVGIW